MGASLFLFTFEEMAVIRGMLTLGQSQERANDTDMEQRFMIFAVFAERHRRGEMIFR